MPSYVVPSARARRIVREDDAEPEQRLWATVLACAARDGLLSAWCRGEDQEIDEAPGAGELTRCRCGGECFRLVVGWAGLEPEVVRQRAGELLAEAERNQGRRRAR